MRRLTILAACLLACGITYATECPPEWEEALKPENFPAGEARPLHLVDTTCEHIVETAINRITMTVSQQQQSCPENCGCAGFTCKTETTLFPWNGVCVMDRHDYFTEPGGCYNCYCVEEYEPPAEGCARWSCEYGCYCDVFLWWFLDQKYQLTIEKVE